MTNELTQKVDISTIQYTNSTSKNLRKKIGQFFTPISISRFMASLYVPTKEKIRVLDCGAGTGILLTALAEEVLKYDNVNEVFAVLYENNEDIIPVLKENMEYIKAFMKEKGKSFDYEIICSNFIIDYSDFWRNNLLSVEAELFDVIIANPPYKKIGKSDIEAMAMESIVFGQPNIYFLFMAMSAKLLNENGQLIFIVPRSFTTGAYFKEFRRYFLNTVKITHFHTFSSRKDVFDGDEILQEAVILRALKTNEEIETIKISESENLDYGDTNFTDVPTDVIIDNSDNNYYIRIPTSKGEIELLEHIGKWKNNLITLGFRLKTGPVVDFRATEFLINDTKYDGANTVPLLWASNFNSNRIQWPSLQEKKPQVIISSKESRGVLLPNKDYILVKRFTSKEEPKRIQCAMYFKEDFNCELVGVENHLNYITKLTGDMSREEMYGIFTLFNSSYIDKYYRLMNGSTQVNAGEANSIPLPNRAELLEIGRMAMAYNIITVEICDGIVDEFLNKNREVKSQNRGGNKMAKLEEAKQILQAFGLPKQQQNDRCAYTLLALLDIKEGNEWREATNNPLGIHEIMVYMAEHYGKIYAENSRETIRKETIHQFMQAVIAERNVDEGKRATNSPNYRYCITKEALTVCQAFNTAVWERELNEFKAVHSTLQEKYTVKREMVMIPVTINGVELQFSPGKHNELQKAIVEEFAPRFAPASEVLYVGDTEKKDLVKNRERLAELGIIITDHDKLPDVVLYLREKNWLFLIEAVTSVGPVSPKRQHELQEMLVTCKCGLIYVTAFLNMGSKDGYKKFAEEIAWETEVWIADMPNHMIHLNGDRFLGPRNIKG